MQVPEASVADVLRCAQRDQTFVQDIQNNLQSLAKAFGIRNYRKVHSMIAPATDLWYYFMTTLGNVQTLGEEYTGTLRINEGQIPSKLTQIMWLSLYIGGEPLLDRLTRKLYNNVKNSNELAPQAQTVILKIIEFLQRHKQTLKRAHYSLFYINGKYNNISNRVVGIKYVLVRQWLQDDTFTNSFKLLGRLSLLYVLFDFVQQMWSKNGGIVAESRVVVNAFPKTCVLCTEDRKNACATPCGHVFCWECIHDSLTYQHACPICREAVLPSRIIFLQNYV